MVSFSVTIASLFYIIMLGFVYFSKIRVNNLDNKLYSSLIITTVVGIFVQILLCAADVFDIMAVDSPLYLLLVKMVLIYYIVWLGILALYTYVLSSKDSQKYVNAKKVFYFSLVIMICCILVLPVSINKTENAAFPEGAGVNAGYLFSAILILFMIVNVIKNIKNIKNKKYIPLLTFFSSGLIIMIVQANYPQLLLLTPLETFITFLMYFTIENPDVKMIKEVTLAKNQAERSNRAKSDFLSSMSHEIRTPLNAIVGLSEDNLTYSEQLPYEVIENSKDIVNASQTLLEIVGNILDINKIEANKLVLVDSEYKFKEEVLNMCKVTQTRIGEKDIIFNLDIADDVPYEIIGDKGKVKEIINNLLTNSIKYTDQGRIDLVIKCINDINNNKTTLIITCKDTGKGIKADYINRLFNKFDRLDIEKNSTVEGTGLGLAITKSLVEMMGGKINVQSTYGEGSLFMVQIPQKISKLFKPMTEDELSNTLKLALEEKIDLLYAGKKILIVDDNKINIKVARKALKDFDLVIDECYDGTECLQKIQNGEKFDLILLDIMMPNMNGETCLKELKKIDGFNIPTIALTADAIAGAKEKYIKDGFFDYLSKPFSKEQIKEKMNMIFVKDLVNLSEKTLQAELSDEISNEEQYLIDNMINYNKGVELFGNLKTYKDMLNDWYDEAEDKYKYLDDYFAVNDLNNYSILVHTLKSDSKYFGFDRLAELAYEHELKSKDNDLSFIRENFHELKTEFNRILLVLKQYLKK